MEVISTAYAGAVNELTRRILVLIPDHPEILSMHTPWDLFEVDGFKCDDLQPSMAQATFALSKAQYMHRQFLWERTP